MPNQTDAPLFERVFLIDAMSHIFRAYFAPMGMRAEPLTNSHGQVTQAVFVFTSMLRKLLADEQPHYIAAVFESGEKTFRHDNYAEYKANRAAMPDDLLAQLPYIVRVCEAFNIPVINSPGFEADDVIGALALQAVEQNLQAVIVSNDKDMCQLVRDPLIVCLRQNSQNIKRKVPVPPVEWCDEAWVENKFGVPPAQIIDLLGLMGDSVDNIPGAPGIGEKGAQLIIKEFGSIENALTEWEKVKNKRYRESLRDNADLIRQSRELATIRTDVPVTLDLALLKHGEPDRPAAYQLFRELEFQSLIREFSDAAGEAAALRDSGAGEVARRYNLIRTQSELDALVRALWDAEHWAFAVAAPTVKETVASEADAQPANVVTAENDFPAELSSVGGIAVARAAGQSSYVDVENFADGAESALAALSDVLANGLLEKSVHDLKNAYGRLREAGVELEGVTDDTQLAAYLLDPIRSQYELDALARENADAEPQTEIPDDWTLAQWRAAEAADFTLRVAPQLRARLVECGLEEVYTELELPLAPLLYRMERAGLKVDTEVLAGLSEFLGAELEKLTTKIYELAGREFNINSPKQLGEIFVELNIDTGRKTATGQVSTGRAILDELAEKYELPRKIIEYRELEKLKSVYTDALPQQVGADGRIHGQLNQTVAATGRLSSTNPNLQNIPIRTELGRRIRRAFIPEAGCKYVAADYSQLELRILAHVTRDAQMLDAFQKNEDIHERTTRLVFKAQTPAELKEKRRLAKIVNFAIAYAVEAFGLSQRVGLSRAEARQVIADYYETYKGVREYMDAIPLEAKENGYVKSLYGRRRPLPGINDRNHNVRSRAEREAINMPIQGTASDIVKRAMLMVDAALQRAGLRAKFVMQVHDELLIEAPSEEIETVTAILKREMENAAQLDVPLLVEIGSGENWMDTKPA